MTRILRTCLLYQFSKVGQLALVYDGLLTRSFQLSTLIPLQIISDSSYSGLPSLGCSYTRSFLHTFSLFWMVSTSSASPLNMPHQKPLTSSPTCLVARMATKAWGSLASVSTGSTLVHLSWVTPLFNKVCPSKNANMCLKTDGHVLANSWIGYFFCYIAIMGIYYSNTWNVSLAVFRLQKDPMVTCYVFTVSCFPYAFVFNFLRQRVCLSPIRRFRNNLHVEPDRITRSRSSCFNRWADPEIHLWRILRLVAWDRFQCMGQLNR